MWDRPGGDRKPAQLPRHITLERHAMHHAAKAVIVVDRVVLGAAIVPQRDRPWLPAKTAREFRARRVGKKIAQQRRALFNRHVAEAQRVAAVGVKSLAAGLR